MRTVNSSASHVKPHEHRSRMLVNAPYSNFVYRQLAFIPGSLNCQRSLRHRNHIQCEYNIGRSTSYKIAFRNVLRNFFSRAYRVQVSFISRCQGHLRAVTHPERRGHRVVGHNKVMDECCKERNAPLSSVIWHPHNDSIVYKESAQYDLMMNSSMRYIKTSGSMFFNTTTNSWHSHPLNSFPQAARHMVVVVE